LKTTPLIRTFSRQLSTEAPDVAGKEILISGDVERSARNAATGNVPPPFTGMIVTQGNATNGYGVYMLDGKLYFQINQNGKPYQVGTSAQLPAKFSFKAGLQKNGTMRLLIDQKEAGSLKAPGLFNKDLEIPLRVGSDITKGKDRIAQYPDSVFFLRAGLSNAKLETLEGIAAPVVKNVVKIDQVINLSVLKDVMKYDKQLLTAKAGTTIQIVLQNPDFMQHNLLLIKPNTMEKVGAAADLLAQDPNGAKSNYVPKMPEVLGATPLINPGGKFTLTVKIPDIPGDYPYVCTFPGHWRIMNGILRVVK
jgi:azurin